MKSNFYIAFNENIVIHYYDDDNEKKRRSRVVMIDFIAAFDYN